MKKKKNSPNSAASVPSRKIEFDPSTTVSADLGIFGLPLTEEEAKVVLLPVPWEVTTSYGKGASDGPRLIRQASEQIDLFDLRLKKNYEAGYFMRPVPKAILALNRKLKPKAQLAMRRIAELSSKKSEIQKLVATVNAGCEEMNNFVYQNSKNILKSGKILGIVGGDHSTPLGAIRAVSEMHNGNFGILHIDAHADLRDAYQGFTYSHASIMFNVMRAPFRPQRLVQVGIRDFSEEEYQLTQQKGGAIRCFFDRENRKAQFAGETWDSICKRIVRELPQKVYVSFDIDGLNPSLCPNTGTPVAGGLSLDEVQHLFALLADSGKSIVGFDLNEVSSGGRKEAEWDGNVGARVLFQLCGWAVETNQTPALA